MRVIPTAKISSLLVLLVGCTEPCSLKKAQELMGHHFNTAIELDAYPVITADTLFDSDFQFSPERYYIIHHINTSCDNCVNIFKAIAELLPNYRKIDNLEFLFIAEGPFRDIVHDAIEEVNFEGKVFYADGKEPFKEKHGLPPEDEVYDTMLVDGEGRLVMAGAFFINEKAEAFFLDIVAQDCEG